MKLKQTVTSSGTIIEESCGNIFADLGLPNPEERMLKASLAIEISDLIDAKDLTQKEAAKLSGIAQPHLSDITRGRLSGYSVGKLLHIINSLGRRVELRISAQDVKPERAVTTVCMR